MTAGTYIQYGCGWSAPDGWRNFDASLTLRFERLPLLGRLYTKNKSRFPENVEYGDIVKGLPLPDESCSGVYCSHVLEHLSLYDFRTALKNTKKVMAPNSLFRLVLPDLEYSIRRYLDNPADNAAHEFITETGVGCEERSNGIKGFLVDWLGNSQHLWCWDYKAIAVELQHAGFVDIRRAAFRDSSDAKFREIEDKDRWDNCLGAECRKPG